MNTITVHIDDNSPEVLEALKNAVDRAAMAIGEKAVTYAKDNLDAQHAVDKGRLRNSIAYMIKDE